MKKLATGLHRILSLLLMVGVLSLLPSIWPSADTQISNVLWKHHVHQAKHSLGCVVIVHLGDGGLAGRQVVGIPVQQTAQIVDCVEQIRLFNPSMPIYIVVSAGLNLTMVETSRLELAKAVLVTIDQLPRTPEHQHWQQQSGLAKAADRNFFWRYASERFFYLSDVAIQLNLSNIIHIVSDQLRPKQLDLGRHKHVKST